MAVFRRIHVDFPFCTVGADGPVRPPELSGFTEIRCEFATFWRADVGIGPYKRQRKISRFCGRTGPSAPTTGIGKPCVGRKIAAFPVSPTPQKNANTPRRGGRTLLHWVSISHRRGRCLHRPAERTRFMVLFRRIHVDFPFCTVGADDPVRPPELSGFTEIRCEFATFLRANVGIGPYKRPQKIAGF